MIEQNYICEICQDNKSYDFNEEIMIKINKEMLENREKHENNNNKNNKNYKLVCFICLGLLDKPLLFETLRKVQKC